MILTENQVLTIIKSLLISMVIIVCLAIQYEINERRHISEIEAKDAIIRENESFKNDVQKVEKEIRKNQPKMNSVKAYNTAVLIVAGHRVYPESPLEFKMACIKMETEFNPDVVGPCGEHGLFQIYLPSFGAYYRLGKWGNPMKEFIAGLLHYNECYKVALKACPDNEKERLKLSLTLHNSGYGWRNPFASYGVTKPHQIRMVVLNIWNMISV
jgi:hypothetical protein